MTHSESTQPAACAVPRQDPGAAWFTAIRAGDFAAAFAANDRVLAARDPACANDPTRPYHERWVWDGRPLQGRHVLVRCYHGLGDTIQFCRYLPALGRIAARVTVEAQPAVLPILAAFSGIELHPFDPAAPLPPAEVDVEIMELAHALRRPPDPTPYLHATPLHTGGVGVCWQGGGWDTARDVPFARIAAALPPSAISLQRGAPSPLPDPLDGSMDLGRLARLVAGLDAVVTVDTMVAHLAGALGRPVFLLLKHDPDWRWGAACRWYSTIRPYTQPRPGDWATAIARLAPHLASHLDHALGNPATPPSFVGA